MLLFLAIQMVGIAAMETSQERSPCWTQQESTSKPRRLRRNTVTLKKQKVKNPVFSEISFCKIKF